MQKASAILIPTTGTWDILPWMKAARECPQPVAAKHSPFSWVHWSTSSMKTRSIIKRKNSGLQLLWITPLRALAKILPCHGRSNWRTRMNWKVGIRKWWYRYCGREKQNGRCRKCCHYPGEPSPAAGKKKDTQRFSILLKIIAVDEWHELLGSKRGVQVGWPFRE